MTGLADRGRFLADIFHGADLTTEVMCLAFRKTQDGQPDTYPKRQYNERSRVQLSGAWYVCISTVRIPEKWLKAGEADLMRTYALVLDDIGTAAKSKVSPDAIKLPPSGVVETSLRNHQYWYLLPEGGIEPGDAKGAVEGLITAGLTDPGCRGAYRIVRLPGSQKKPGGFKARLLSWDASRRFALEDIMAGLGAEMGSSRARVRAPWLGDAADDPYLRTLIKLGLVTGDTRRGWYDIVCPWADEHSDPRADLAGYHLGGVFFCFHGHGDQDRTREFKDWLSSEHGVDCTALDTELNVALAGDQMAYMADLARNLR